MPADGRWRPPPSSVASRDVGAATTVLRDRLSARIATGARVVLIVAPPGYGRTVDTALERSRGARAGLSYAEIGKRRFLSVNTVKSNLKTIYRKLAVTTRSEAVDTARAAGLL